MAQFKTNYELEKEKKEREKRLEISNTKIATMDLGISEKVQTEMAKLCSRGINIDDVRMLKTQLDIFLESYDEEVMFATVNKKKIVEINDVISKREKERADRERVAELRAQADALEKRIEAANDDETI